MVSWSLIEVSGTHIKLDLHNFFGLLVIWPSYSLLSNLPRKTGFKSLLYWFLFSIFFFYDSSLFHFSYKIHEWSPVIWNQKPNDSSPSVYSQLDTTAMPCTSLNGFVITPLSSPTFLSTFLNYRHAHALLIKTMGKACHTTGNTKITCRAI